MCDRELAQHVQSLEFDPQHWKEEKKREIKDTEIGVHYVSVLKDKAEELLKLSELFPLHVTQMTSLSAFFIQNWAWKNELQILSYTRMQAVTPLITQV